MAFLLAVGACLVLILGSGLLLGVLELGRFLQVGLALSTIPLQMSGLLTIMANNVLIPVFTVGTRVVAALLLLVASTFGLLELRLPLLVSFAFTEAAGVRLMEGASPLLATIIAIGAGGRKLFQAGAAVRVELRVFLVALL